MKFEELLYQPVRAPLEGFDKAVATGFEIAQNQERLRQAQERLNLEKQQIQQEYLTKGIGTLSTLSKVKSQKQRKILSDMLMQYMSKGGLPFKQETVDALLSDEDTSVAFSDALVQGQKQYPGDPVLAWTKAAELANMDPDTAIDQAQKLRQAQLAAGEKRSLEEFKTEADVRKEATKRYVEISKKPIPPQIITRSKELYPGDVGKQAEYRELYFSAVGDRIGAIRAGVRAGLPEAKKNPQKYKDLMQALVEAESQYIPNTDKSIDAVNKAEEIFGELKGTYKPKETTAKTEKPTEILGLLKSAQGILEKALTTEQRTRADQLNQIIATANDPAMRKNAFSGQGALSALGRVNDPRSSIREEEYKRIARESGNAVEGIRSAFEKAFFGNALTEKQWADLNRVANFYQQRIKKDLDKRITAVKPRLLKAGITEEEIYATIQPFETATFGIVKEQKPAFFPTPTGEAPQRQSQSKGTIPFSKLKERAKAKNKSIESLEKDALSQGYLIDRSR